MELTIGGLVLLGVAFLLAGIMDAVSGGGGLISLPMFMVIGFPAHLIAGTNQCACVLGSVTACGRYIKNGKMYWPTALLSAPVAVVGAWLGAKLNLFLPERYLQIIMIAVLPVVAVVILCKREFGTENRVATLSRGRQAAVAVGIGLILGGYTGFYGAGAGTFMLLCFALLNRLDLVTASANTRMCSLFANVAASITYALSGAVVWPAVAAAMAFNVVGNYIGTGLAIRNGAKVIRPMFIAVLGLLFVRLVFTAFF